ncbi:sigma factor-like helix-turn-helix DNA-binding protein [Ligilactobacillus ceti]|uniref:RNA polymerase sigma factor 70 region 4 type 2 domain-containing protein n=1 Tax=Ligilactobacillus ceti DSM 22408 TaxID=1122146 RepID=A0A0R2KH41_9LACO|nr:sigma factor-like helix-turn-helix DNA-binding protein [Ligilactobacillus ceti]KRN88707.1 hypothetical protein IV53_GL000674 [Ligilactobacillus ceti DSM 22408]
MKADQKKQYVIQMEVTKESIKDLGINPKEVSYQKVGSEYKLVHLIKTDNEELYKEFMQPVWREAKEIERKRNAEMECKKTALSLDELYENYKYETLDYNQESALERLEKEELLEKLNKLVEELDEIDKQIFKYYMEEKSDSEIADLLGSKRTTVNYQRRRIFSNLKNSLEDYL